MTSPPLDSTHGRTMSCVTCHHCLWTTHSVKQHRVWHAIITVGQHTRSNDFGCVMTSPPLDSTHGRTTLGMSLHHRPWTAHTVGNVGHGMTSPPLDNIHGRQRRAWHAITALGQHTRLDYVRRGMTSPHLDSTQDRTTSSVTCHHRL